MAIIIYESQSIYSHFRIMIDYLLQQRDSITSNEVKIAINMSILLNSSCYLEGVLENRAKDVLNHYVQVYSKVDIPDFNTRKQMNQFFNSIKEDMEYRISQCTGLERYDELFKLLLGKKFSSEAKINGCLEAIKVLGQLRNVIAHGREVNARVYVTNREAMTGDEYFKGGYQKAESLLLKEGIIKDKFIDRNDIDELFSDKTADYFLKKTDEFVEGLDSYISDSKQVEDFFETLFGKFKDL